LTVNVAAAVALRHNVVEIEAARVPISNRVRCH
jgi:hypothetical protein